MSEQNKIIEWIKEHKVAFSVAVAGITLASAGAIFLLAEASSPGKGGFDEELMRLDGFDFFGVPTRKLKQLVEHFQNEMDKGLKGEKSTLKMITSFVGKPTGAEKGSFYAIDLGGTNLRVIRLDLEGDRKLGSNVKQSYHIPQQIMEGTGEQLFDFIAESVGKFLENEHKDTSAPFGFTFSFPVNQTGVDSGELIQWTKGFTASGVEGKDVVQLLQEAFARKKINAKVVALVNDTVGTMVTRSYIDSKCEMGVILGTGTNAAYYEKLSNITKYKGTVSKGDGMLINMEWGAFGDSTTFLPLTKYDKQLDAESVNPGKQIFEKLISGMYLGTIVKLVLLDLLSKGRIFLGVSSIKEPFETAYITRVLSDNSEDLSDVDKLLKEKFDINSSTLEDRKLLLGICRLVTVRAARLSATAIAAVVSKIKKLNCSVAIDGSVFEHIPGFKQKMEETLKELYPQSDIELVLTNDGSGNGAAIIAATVA